MLLMDDDDVVAIICYKVILENEGTEYGDKALSLFRMVVMLKDPN